MKKIRYSIALLFIIPALSFADNYPTSDRINYVLFCMDDIGGQSFDNLHTCSCRIDAISELMLFAEYEDATTFERYRRMPGKKGGIVRDSKRAGLLSEKLTQVGKQVARRCKKVINVSRELPKS